MTDTWLHKQRTMHAGPISLTVSIPVEVADMLRTTENHVRVATHHGRKKKAD